MKMNSKSILSALVVTLMSLSAFSALGSAENFTPSAASETYIGSYALDLGSSGLVTNISYVSSATSTLLVNNLLVNGSSTLNIGAGGGSTPAQTGLSKLSILNATMYSQPQMSALAVVTFSNITGTLPYIVQKPQMKLDFNNSIKEVPLGGNSTFEGPFGDYINQTLLLNVDENFSLFKIDNSVFNGYFFTNGNFTLSNSDKTISIQGNNNRISLDGTAFSILVSGLVRSENLSQILNDYQYLHQNYPKFTYNSTTGAVSGQYVNFIFNQNAGKITNFVSNEPTLAPIFTSITTSGDGSIGTPLMMPYVTTGQVLLYGSLFFYASNTYIYSVHNNPTIQTSILVNNGTVQMVLDSSLSVTSVPRAHGMPSGNNFNGYGFNMTDYQNQGLGLGNSIYGGENNLMISSNNIRGFISITGGDFTYSSATHTITVSTSDFAQISFVMPPGMRDLTGGVFNTFQYAYQHGKIAGQYSLDYLNGTPLNYSYLYNYSLDLNFLGSSPGHVHFKASSQSHSGANIAFFINNKFLNATNGINVYVDGKQINSTNSLANLVNDSGNGMYYAAFAVQNGYMIILHVGNFSTHDIVISGVSSSAALIPSWAIVGIVVAAVVIIGATLYFRMRR